MFLPVVLFDLEQDLLIRKHWMQCHFGAVMPCSFSRCGFFACLFWVVGGWLLCCFVWSSYMELALPGNDFCSTFEPPKRDIVNACP